MTPYRDHHATIFVPADSAMALETVRRRWDPLMAAQIAAHVTLAYPHEAPDPDLLIARVRAASAHTAPFRLRLAEFAYVQRPEDGIYIAMTDVDGGWRQMRALLLQPPFRPTVFPPHLTLAHPRTSTQGRALWEQRHAYTLHGEFIVDAVAVTAFDGTRWDVVEHCAL